MGSYRISKESRLYWLGRYVERALVTIQYVGIAWDHSLDGPAVDYADWCARMQIPCEYESQEQFLESYLFDAENPNSVPSSIDRAFDNAVVLREVLTSQTLAYLQMAKNTMDNASASDAPMLDLQQVRDYLMAFKGSADENISDEASRMTLKCGFTIERIDMMVRMDAAGPGDLEREADRLSSRLRRTHLARDGRRLQLLGDMATCPNAQANRDVLLDCVENLLSGV